MAFDLYSLQQSTLGEFALPFVFIFAVVFGVMQVSGIIREKNINLIIALAMSLFASLYQPLNIILWQVMPYAAGILLILFFLKLVLNLVGVKGVGEVGNNAPIVLVILILLIIVLGTLSNTGLISLGTDSQNTLWIIGLIVFALILIIAYQMKDKDEQKVVVAQPQP